MSNLNRRNFLQIMGAASTAPLFPALAPKAMAKAAPKSFAKALWSGIYAKSGSAPKFLAIAHGMGLSNPTAQGVSARSIGVKIAITTGSSPVAQTLNLGQPSVVPPPQPALNNLRIPQSLERLVLREVDEPQTNAAASEPEPEPE